MSNRTFVWISLGASFVSLILSVIVLVNYCPTQGLTFDYMGVIVGILALLVTALVGAQVGQYVFVDRKIENISSKITRTIARKVAQDEARAVAQNETQRIASRIAETTSKETAGATAMEIVGSLPEDVAVMLKGKDYMKDASQYSMLNEDMKAIDHIMSALAEYKKCQSEILYKSSVDDALKELVELFEYCEKNGGLRILKGKRSGYEEILTGIRSNMLTKCIDYLSKADEKDERFDNDYQEEQSEKEIDSIFNGVKDVIEKGDN